MTRYQCSNCKINFEHRRGRLRCPKCLRQHGLDEISDRHKPEPGSTARLLGITLILLALAGVGYAGLLLVQRSSKLPEPGQLALLGPGEIRRTLSARGIPEQQIINPFAPDPAVQELVPSGLTAKMSVTQRASRIAQHIADKLSMVEVDLLEVTQPIRTAAQLARTIKADEPLKRALSYELAVLVTAALRSADITALLAEMHEQQGAIKTADPNGALGRYVVLVYRDADSLSDKPALVLDPTRATTLPPWAGSGQDRNMTSQAIKPEPLDDGSAAARYLSLAALVAINKDASRPERAYDLMHHAIDASAPSAVLHAARSLVLAGAGGLEDAVREARRAVTLRQNPAMRTLLARFLALQRDVAGAETLLGQALERDPRFWPAHHALAVLSWTRGDLAGGDAHLDKAADIASTAPSVVVLMARRSLRNGEVERAVQLLNKLSEDHPSDQVLLQLYLAQQAAGQTDQAQATRERLLKSTSNREQAEKILSEIEAAAGAQN